MKKTILIGLATLTVASSAIIGTSIYAASSTQDTTGATRSMRGMTENRSENMINSLSGKVSTEALNALETLMKKHQTEMDAMRTSSATLDESAMKTKREAFKTEMEALMTKYPELKTAMPTHMERKWGMWRHGRWEETGFWPMNSVISSLTTDEQAKVKAIRENYRTKMGALRAQEKAEMETVINGNATAKAQYAEMEKNRPTPPSSDSTTP